MSPPVIAVLGATGSQGGGAVAALQKQGKFGIRAITRSADKAKELTSQGVEVVEADMGDKQSLQHVRAPCMAFAWFTCARAPLGRLQQTLELSTSQAFKGATGLFLVTDFYGCGGDPETEMQHGRNAIDAAKEVSAPRRGPWGCPRRRCAAGAAMLGCSGRTWRVRGRARRPESSTSSSARWRTRPSCCPRARCRSSRRTPGMSSRTSRPRPPSRCTGAALVCWEGSGSACGGPALCQRRTAHVLVGEGGRALARSLRGGRLHASRGVPCTCLLSRVHADALLPTTH